MRAAEALDFGRDGARHFPGAVGPLDLMELESAVSGLPSDRAGTRIGPSTALSDVLSMNGAIGRVAAVALGPAGFAVRAVLFDKTGMVNWSLGWHQDRTIVVRERRDTAGFGPWTIKQGLLHVAPPIEVLASMVTVRVHLDPVPADNAPLLVAIGTHRLGIVPETGVEHAVAAASIVACLAERGDAWLYSTLILHASAASARPARRRVLQIDYAAAPLPGGLEWVKL